MVIAAAPRYIASARVAWKKLLPKVFYCCVMWLSLGPRREDHSFVTVYGDYLATAVVYRVIT
jgi:hypothetical protein